MITVIITVFVGGRKLETRIEDMTVNALDYASPTFGVADMINEQYSWYNTLPQVMKEFIYPHLLASYAACNHSKQLNRVHIIM